MAGGRISGAYAEAAGTTVKALVPVGGVPVARRVAQALVATTGVERICIVGPEAVSEVAGDLCTWVRERDSALANFLAGVEHLASGEDSKLLLCGTDVAMLEAAALDDFVARAPADADLCLPVVRREAFDRQYSDGRWVYVPLADGQFTGGSQFIVRPGAIVKNMPLIDSLFERRKSQVAMARTLGLPFILKLLTRRLRIAELEGRVSALTGCQCRAVLDCQPELAFDIDNLAEWRYADRLAS
jgi:hypothetical protein